MAIRNVWNMRGHVKFYNRLTCRIKLLYAMRYIGEFIFPRRLLIYSQFYNCCGSLNSVAVCCPPFFFLFLAPARNGEEFTFEVATRVSMRSFQTEIQCTLTIIFVLVRSYGSNRVPCSFNYDSLIQSIRF